MEARQIIIRPVITERSFYMQEYNRFTFEVAKTASKIEIAKAVEEIFDVKVLRVNTVNVKSKKKRMRNIEGKTRTWKKAIVTLAEGDTIELFANQD